jgi:hypothetical protein
VPPCSTLVACSHGAAGACHQVVFGESDGCMHASTFRKRDASHLFTSDYRLVGCVRRGPRRVADARSGPARSVSQVGHFLHLEAPAAVNELIVAWIKKHARA